jgi:hypothetical protein
VVVDCSNSCTSVGKGKRANNLCIECSVLPSVHKCRRCKQYVCNMCCSTNRGLEMVWWC